ncbi:MAG: hypothetical protein KGI41_01625, partial [Patescibacteria group bacterium]|nr:hypothetical protein [Patescibacteria group bacterium]
RFSTSEATMKIQVHLVFQGGANQDDILTGMTSSLAAITALLIYFAILYVFVRTKRVPEFWLVPIRRDFFQRALQAGRENGIYSYWQASMVYVIGPLFFSIAVVELLLILLKLV